jgi:hypothetical protein
VIEARTSFAKEDLLYLALLFSSSQGYFIFGPHNAALPTWNLGVIG